AKEGKSQKKKSFNLDRGFDAEFKALFDAVLNGTGNPVDFEEYIYTTRVTFKAIESLKTNQPQVIDGLFE
ncbi:MAG: hypothetical protein AABZ57_06675, partial [Candidatus Margulisiibacteriota bacterium]